MSASAPPNQPVNGMAPTFSVAIRGYRPDLLREAVASVLAQTFTDLELVVYDDHGGLDTVVAEFGDPRVRHVPAKPGERNSAKVRSALGLCRGSYVGALDDDDRYEPTFLERVFGEFERDPGVGIVSTDHLWDIDGRLVPRRLRFPAGTHADMVGHLLSDCPVAMSAAMLRREAWDDGERIKPIPDDVWADRFIWLRTAELGWSFHYIDEPLMIYRVHQRQMSASHDMMREPGVATLEAFAFSDPEDERLRQVQLAASLIARAAHDLSHGRHERPREDLRRARGMAQGRDRMRAALLQVLAVHPRLAPRVASMWRRRPRLPALWIERLAAGCRLSVRSRGRASDRARRHQLAGRQR